MTPKVFIDGQEGTTGLQLLSRLNKRTDIDLIEIDSALRKDLSERRRLYAAADLVFLCLPDDAAREAVSMIASEKTRVIDASTAHRTHPDWVYGFPELSSDQRAMIADARFVANPGCHATGIIAAVYPLVAMKILPRDYPLTCFSLTGYSGGGKSMIHGYENKKTPDMLAPRIYGLNQNHKHLPEITHVIGLSRPPVFCPVVDDYYSGMASAVLLHNDLLLKANGASEIRDALFVYYAGERFITVSPASDDGMLESNWGVGSNKLEITVSGNDARTVITSRFDNLGKGASGAAVQNMEIMLKLTADDR